MKADGKRFAVRISEICYIFTAPAVNPSMK